MNSIIDTSVSLFNLIGPFMIYLPQYFLMKRTKSVGSFSVLIPYMMLIAQSLRLIFYISNRYHWSLFIQSFILVLIHSILLYQYYKMKYYEEKQMYLKSEEEEETNSNEESISRKKSELMSESYKSTQDENNQMDQNRDPNLGIESDNELIADHLESNPIEDERSFEKNNISQNIKVVIQDVTDTVKQLSKAKFKKKKLKHYSFVFKTKILKLFVFIITYLMIFLLINSQWFVQLTGLFSCIIESCIPVPQFIKNCRNKNLHSVSIFMIFCWFVGDVLKMKFLLDKKQPTQFIIGGCNMILFDFLIVTQFFIYGNKKKVLKKINKELGN